MSAGQGIVITNELFVRLKSIFGLPDKVLSMSIELPGARRAVELKLTMLINRDQSDALIEVLREYQLEKKGDDPCQQEN